MAHTGGVTEPAEPAKMTLRERRTARTRQLLIQIAQRRFQENGYDSTSLEDIAGEAEVSVTTVWRYFQGKEALALAPVTEQLDVFRGHLEDPTRERSVLDFYREWVADNCWKAASLERSGAYGWVDSVPALTKGLHQIAVEAEVVLAEALAREAGADPATDLHSRCLAALVHHSYEAALRQWRATGGSTRDLTRICLETIDYAIAHFAPRTTAETPGATARRRPRSRRRPNLRQ